MKKKETFQKEFFYGASPEIFKRAAELRKHMTDAEKVLWEALRGKKLSGLRFRRQHPVSRFIVDFYCHKLRLVIEVDGGIHKDKLVREKDDERSNELLQHGLKLIRFTNEEVLSSLQEVLQSIRNHCQEFPFPEDLESNEG